MSRPMPFRWVACLVSTIAILAGCETGPTVSSPPSMSAQEQLYGAEQLLIAGCMNRAGFSYWPSSTPPQDPILMFPYGLTSLRWAERYGFGVLVSLSTERNERYIADLSPAQLQKYVLAFNGPGRYGPSVTYSVPSGSIEGHSLLGCQAASEGLLYRSFARWDKTKTSVEDLRTIEV